MPDALYRAFQLYINKIAPTFFKLRLLQMPLERL